MEAKTTRKPNFKHMLLLLVIVALLVSMVVLSACDDNNNKPTASPTTDIFESLFESAKNGGYTGTKEQFTESLKEALKGKDGIDGEDGADGKDGVNGTDGKDGVNGTDGKDGVNGTDGKDGVNGTDGKDGEDGIGIKSIVKTATVGSVDLYTLTLTNNVSSKFTIENADVEGSLGAEVKTDKDKFIITDAVFNQTDNSLKGSLNLNVYDAASFGKVTYSVFREGAQIGDKLYVDYIKQDVEVTNDVTDVPLTAGYHGNYQVEVKYFTTATDASPVYVYNKKGVDFKAEKYTITYMNATLPVLLSTAKMITADRSTPHYIGISRNATYDWYNLPENCYGLPNTTYSKGTTKLAIYNASGVEKTSDYGKQSFGTWGSLTTGAAEPRTNIIHMKKWVRDLYEMDKDSTFEFNCVDNTCRTALQMTYGISLPTNRFSINIFTDGTATVYNIEKYNLNEYSKWKTVRAQYLDWIKNLKDDTSLSTSIPTYSFVMCADSNVNYYVNTKDSIIQSVNTKNAANKDKLIEIYNDHITQYTVDEAFAEVETAGKTKELELLLRTRWIDNENEEGSASQYFETNNNKKNLMIIGTSLNGENDSNDCSAKFLEMMDHVVATYGANYNIFYKGHPSWPITKFSDGRADYFAEKGIIVLPNSVPAETYMYLYNEVYIGGYYSSTMASSMKGQTLFYFGKEANITSQTPTAAMFDKTASDYQGIFEGVSFIFGELENGQTIIKSTTFS